MSSTEALKSEGEWTTVTYKKEKKLTKSPKVSAYQRLAPAEIRHNELIGFVPIPEKELRNLPREVRIAHADEKLAKEKQYKKDLEERHLAWRKREENRSRKAWKNECLSNGACFTCGDLTHHTVDCNMPEAEPVWLENDVLRWRFPSTATQS